MRRGQAIAVALAAACMLGGSAFSAASFAQIHEESARRINAGRPADGAFHIDFTAGFDRVNYLRADWDVQHPWLAVSYRAANVVFDRDGMTLKAFSHKTPVAEHSSAELQRVGYYGYGRYEVVMRASDASGVVSAFFVYTGPDVDDPHDEIDFEFIGRSPRKVHLNHFRNGANDPVDVDLGFDATEDLHLYAFEWTPNSITWYADGRKLRQVTASSSKVPIPAATGRVMTSLWAANGQTVQWVGEPDFIRATALYTCMSHVPLGKTGKQCSDTFKSGGNN